MAAGLPTITTPVPPLGQEIAQFGAGVIAQDNAKAIARAIVRVFSDAAGYRRLRKRAIQFSKNNTWENEFRKAFLAMEKRGKSQLHRREMIQ
jgi:glycosyltransferase involved in cell wall biosynthesis